MIVLARVSEGRLSQLAKRVVGDAKNTYENGSHALCSESGEKVRPLVGEGSRES